MNNHGTPSIPGVAHVCAPRWPEQEQKMEPAETQLRVLRCHLDPLSFSIAVLLATRIAGSANCWSRECRCSTSDAAPEP